MEMFIGPLETTERFSIVVIFNMLAFWAFIISEKFLIEKCILSIYRALKVEKQINKILTEFFRI